MIQHIILYIAHSIGIYKKTHIILISSLGIDKLGL